MATKSRKIVSSGQSIEDVPHIVNADDNYLFCKYWEPSGRPSFIICMVHGYGAHCARFAQFASRLNEIGGYVFAHDHIGHGESEGEGWYIEDYSVMIRDVFYHVDVIKEKYPDLPVFLFGHSMGGSIAVLAASERPEFFDGVIVSGGSMVVDPNMASPFRLFLLRNVARFFPRMKLMKLTAEYLSRDKDEVKACEDDPLQVPHGLIMQTAQTLVGLGDAATAAMEKIISPLLIVHGGDDRITNIEGSKMLNEKARSSDKTLKIFEGYYHNLAHELVEDRIIFFNFVINWIRERLPKL